MRAVAHQAGYEGVLSCSHPARQTRRNERVMSLPLVFGRPAWYRYQMHKIIHLIIPHIIISVPLSDANDLSSDRAFSGARRGRTRLALQKRLHHTVGPPGPANRNTFRGAHASPRSKTPAVSKWSWGKNDHTFCPILANLGPRSRRSNLCRL